jgi:phosphoglucosamine mutase
VETGADVGLAFDGDGDRFIAVDEKGRTLTGDQLLMIYAKMLKEKHALKNDLVVSTVMSNMGLRTALKKSGIGYIPTSVGDRYVMEAMRTQGSCLGGEDSGHIIFFDHHTTGDGILAALQLINAMLFYKKPVSELSTFMTVFPQTLINVTVQVKPDITEIPEIVRVVEMVEQRLGDEGRVLVRYSGTEPVCRVMVEGRQEQEIKDYASQIADVIRRELG